ncbi:uncharacterized protein LOC131192292 [Ahaetulla prasina]|uniref:uncharacterized protein LOC131192292 n=1 Tax=Ahaetulla prasina TaxID=499056 RepID=UPI002649BE17|nr:uncharacterized protein LOC131192292 [Ahaetulla prasina]
MSLEQPAFTSLFPPVIFKSLLFKATNAVRLGSSLDGDAPQTSRAWLRNTIKSGLSLEFLSTTTTLKVFLCCSVSKDKNKRALMDRAVQHLLDIRAIQRVPAYQIGHGFYSLLFVIPKASGGWRPILALKRLNRYIVYKWFKMQSLQSILAGIRKDDFLTFIVLTEAYLHILIRYQHQEFLRFCYLGAHFHYRTLSFGLSSVPCTFTKILAALVDHLMAISISVQCYFDYILIQSFSSQHSIEDLQVMIQSLKHHGFSINMEKSHLTPLTRLLHLGVVTDSVEGKVYLSQERQDSLKPWWVGFN